MELGEKLKKARLEAGLSQREVCGEVITRNMLSQIEHGSASPSITTLRQLSRALGKPMGYFFEGGDCPVLERAIEAMEAGDYPAARTALKEYEPQGGLYDRCFQQMACLTELALAENAIREKRFIYARELLNRARIHRDRLGLLPELEQRRICLMGMLPDQDPVALAAELPSLDEPLLLKGEAAYLSHQDEQAARLLDAVEEQTNPRWCLVRGRVYLRERKFSQAARCFHGAEKRYPETAAYLEQCYREMGDYKEAYRYACKQKDT